MKDFFKKYWVILVIIGVGFLTAAATIDLIQPEANLITDANGYIRFTSQTNTATEDNAGLNSAAVFKGAVNTTNKSLNISFTDGLVLNGALTGITDITASGTVTTATVTASGTVTGEQLTSTDDATVTDLLTTADANVTDDLTVTDDVTIGGWLTLPSTTVSTQSYTASSTGKASYYIVEYTDTGAATFFLPDTPADGTLIAVKDGDLNAGSNVLAIQTAGSDTIEEAQVYSLTANGKAAGFSYDAGGTDWSLMFDAN